VNVYAAPSSIPGPLDMFLPFGIALLEFMLFTILTTPLINQLDPRTIVVVWFSCFAAFGAVTTTVLARVRWLFEHTDYGSKSLQNAVSNMSKKMAARPGGLQHHRTDLRSCGRRAELHEWVPRDHRISIRVGARCRGRHGNLQPAQRSRDLGPGPWRSHSIEVSE
jgi:hypothetical protein